MRQDDPQEIAQEAPGLRREPPNRFVLAGTETQITYDATAAAGGPRLAYDGPYGSRTFVGDEIRTEESVLGRLVLVNLGAFPDQGDLSLILVLPWFNPMSLTDVMRIWEAPFPFRTLAILKWVVSTIGGPPQDGALEEYDVVALEGTAELVAALPAGVTADELGRAWLGRHDLPPNVDVLALVRVTLPPGATARAVNGAHLFLVEAGALTDYWEGLTLPGYVSTAGDWFLIRHGETPPKVLVNEGTEPAVALVVSLAATGGTGVTEAFPGWEVVEPLAVADAASVSPSLLEPDGSVAHDIGVALLRASFEPEASADLLDILDPAAYLLVGQTGALDVVAAVPVSFTPANGSLQQLPANEPVSLAPGDGLLVATPGRIATRNVAPEASSVLIVGVGPDNGR